MVVSAEARERVYLYSRAIFSGDNANIRSAKRIKELVDQNRQSLTNILTGLGVDQVHNTIQSLLDKRVFESELRAKLEFPELFRSSAARNAERQASEDEAAHSTASRLDEIAAYEGEKCNDKGKGVDYGDPDDEGSTCTSGQSQSSPCAFIQRMLRRYSAKSNVGNGGEATQPLSILHPI